MGDSEPARFSRMRNLLRVLGGGGLSLHVTTPSNRALAPEDSFSLSAARSLLPQHGRDLGLGGRSFSLVLSLEGFRHDDLPFTNCIAGLPFSLGSRTFRSDITI